MWTHRTFVLHQLNDIVLTLQLCNGRTRFEPINTSGPAYNEQLRAQKCVHCNQASKTRRRGSTQASFETQGRRHQKSKTGVSLSVAPQKDWCPPTKLRQGNVFTCVCHSSFCPQADTPSPPLPRRRPLQRTVRILLECILVFFKSQSSFSYCC